MSRFDRVSIPNPSVRGRLPNAPGVDAPPPDMRSAEGAAGVSGLLGVTGGIASVLNSLAEQDLAAKQRAEYEAQRAADRAERDAQRAEVYDRGLGTKHSQRKLAQLRSDISEGRLTVPSDMTPAEFADKILAEDLDGPYSAAYREGYQSIYDNLVNEAIAYKAAATKHDFETKVDLVRNRFMDPALDPSEVQSALAAIKADFPQAKVSDNELIGSTVIPAARDLAAAGDFAAANRLLSTLPEGSFRADRLDIQQMAGRAAEDSRRETVRQFQSRIAAMRNSERPAESIMAAIMADTTVDDNVKESERIATEEYASKRLKALDRQQKELIYRAQVSEWESKFKSGLSGGATVYDLPQDLEASFPDGDTKAIKRQEVLDSAVRSSLQEIRTTITDPNVRIAKEDEFLATRGATDPDRKTGYASAYTRLSALGNIQMAEVPPDLVAYVEEFRRWRSNAGMGRVIHNHLDEKAQRYFNDLANAVESRAGGTTGGDKDYPDAVAMVNSRANAQLFGGRRGAPSEKVVIERAAEVASELGVLDARTVEDSIYMRAQHILDNFPRTSADQAVELAAREVTADFATIDGMAAYVRGGIADVDGVNAIVPAVKDYWATTTASGRNRNTSLDYRMTYDHKSGTFSVTAIEDGIPRGAYDSEFALTADEMSSLASWNRNRQANLSAASELERGDSGSILGWAAVLLSGGEVLPPKTRKPDPASAAKRREMANRIPDGWSAEARAIAERIILSKQYAPSVEPDAITKGMTSFHP